jgi:hypothetical protein
MDVDPDKEALFNEVYDTEHVPGPIPAIGSTLFISSASSQ